MPEILRQYPFVTWERLKPAIQWLQGQHIVTVGGTGSGKSTVAGEFLPYRELVAVCVSKGMDPIFDTGYYSDYERIKKWPPGRRHQRVLLWPPNGSTLRATRVVKANIFRSMFDNVLLKRGYWCIDIDETHYMSDTLGLGPEITDLLEQGRSAGISLWNNTQRPSGIPLATYVNSTHAFFFRTQEEYDVKRLGKMRNRHTTPKEMMANIERLEDHEFVYSDATGRIPPVRSIVTARYRRNSKRRTTGGFLYAA